MLMKLIMPSVGGGQTPPIPNTTVVHNHNAQNSTQGNSKARGEEKCLICISCCAPDVLHNMSPSPSTTSLSHLSASPRQLLPDYCNNWLFHFTTTLEKLLLVFSSNSSPAVTSVTRTQWLLKQCTIVDCREEYLSIKHCLTCGRSVPSKHIAQTSIQRQEGKV